MESARLPPSLSLDEAARTAQRSIGVAPPTTMSQQTCMNAQIYAGRFATGHAVAGSVSVPRRCMRALSATTLGIEATRLNNAIVQ